MMSILFLLKFVNKFPKVGKSLQQRVIGSEQCSTRSAIGMLPHGTEPISSESGSCSDYFSTRSGPGLDQLLNRTPRFRVEMLCAPQ